MLLSVRAHGPRGGRADADAQPEITPLVYHTHACASMFLACPALAWLSEDADLAGDEAVELGGPVGAFAADLPGRLDETGSEDPLAEVALVERLAQDDLVDA